MEKTCSHLFVIYDSQSVEVMNKNILNSKSVKKHYLPSHLGHYYYCKYGCAHRGKYESVAEERTKQKTLKRKCNDAVLHIILDRKNVQYKIKKFNNKHNHELNEHLYQMYSVNRALRGVNFKVARQVEKNGAMTFSHMKSSEINRDVGLLIKSNIIGPNLREYLNTEGNVVATSKDAQNLRQKYNKNTLSDEVLFLQALAIDKEHDSNMIIKFRSDSNQKIQAIYFQYTWQQVFLKQYPEHILMDSTYCLNIRRMPLNVALITDANDVSIPIAFCLVANECKENIDFL